MCSDAYWISCFACCTLRAKIDSKFSANFARQALAAPPGMAAATCMAARVQRNRLRKQRRGQGDFRWWHANLQADTGPAEACGLLASDCWLLAANSFCCF